MKPKHAKLLAVFVCIAIALTTVILFPARLHGAGTDKNIYLYHNDRRWARANHPAHVNEKGVYYAPLTFFVQLGGVNARINDTLQTFVITNGEHYLSFDVISNYAANEDKIRIPLKTYEYDGERYVPIDAVCYYLKLEFESAVSPRTGETVLRVTNGGQLFTLRELIDLRHPSFYEKATTATAKPPSVTAETTEKHPATTEAEKLRDRVIYLTFKVDTGEYVDGILEQLGRYDCKATFFVDPDWCTENIPTLMKILGGGHAVALKGSSSRIDSVDQLLAEMDRGNAVLSALTKYKTRVRSISYMGYIARDAGNAFSKAGYTLWADSVTVPTASRSASAAAQTAIDAIWDNSVCSVGFGEDRKTAEALGDVLTFISGNRSECTIRTVGAAANQ